MASVEEEVPLQDSEVRKAVSRILQRAERQEDIDRLVETFVDVGIVPQIDNKNNQIIYGRRGTGKTHVLRVLEHNLRNDHQVVCYIDTRILGSTTQFTDERRTPAERGLSLFKDLLGEMQNSLLDFVVSHEDDETTKKIDELQTLAEIITRTKSVRIAEKYEEFTGENAATSGRVGLEFGTRNIGASAQVGRSNTAEKENRIAGRVTVDESLIFTELRKSIDTILGMIGCSLFVLIDEWSSVPMQVQPLVAELLKHSLVPIPQIVLKIASLEYRSLFGYANERTFFGFELGSDISANLDIDDYYVYDRNPAIITAKSADILLRHIASETGWDYLKTQYSIETPEAFVKWLFTTDKVFDEMVRASEGVARDLINIFATGFFDASRQEHKKIQKSSILGAARQWFEKDKAQNLDDELQKALQKITEEVIGHRRARSFLVPREMERNEIVQRLFDARVLHLVVRGYADKDNPGKKYNIYTLDYGTYVDLLNTSKEPELDFTELKEVPGDFIVPFDDKRSIRRIVLDPVLLASKSS